MEQINEVLIIDLVCIRVLPCMGDFSSIGGVFGLEPIQPVGRSTILVPSYLGVKSI